MQDCTDEEVVTHCRFMVEKLSESNMEALLISFVHEIRDFDWVGREVENGFPRGFRAGVKVLRSEDSYLYKGYLCNMSQNKSLALPPQCYININQLIKSDPIQTLGPVEKTVFDCLRFVEEHRKLIGLCFPDDAQPNLSNPRYFHLAFLCHQTILQFIAKEGSFSDDSAAKTIGTVKTHLPMYMFELFQSKNPDIYYPRGGKRAASPKYSELKPETKKRYSLFCTMITVPPEWPHQKAESCAHKILTNCQTVGTSCWKWIKHTLKVEERFLAHEAAKAKRSEEREAAKLARSQANSARSQMRLQQAQESPKRGAISLELRRSSRAKRARLAVVDEESNAAGSSGDEESLDFVPDDDDADDDDDDL
jgi:hypothetical protein